MKRFQQGVLIGTFLGFSWLGLQAMHEFGHVIAAYMTGAKGIKVALHPLILSRTDLAHNPHPLVVVWAGPVFGALIPFLTYLVAKCSKAPGLFLFRFFAGACLVANGLYVSFGPAESGTDNDIMMQYGTPRLAMLAFGIPVAALGLYLWHRQGSHFGLADAHGVVNRKAVFTSTILFLATIALELFLNNK